MKKKLIVLSSIVMFSIGLALYANNSSAMKVLSEDNIEALSEGESSGNHIEALTDGEGSGCVCQEMGTYPNRVWVYSDTHIMILEGYRNTTGKKGKYECKRDPNYTCRISTATPISNASSIIDMVKKLLDTLFNGKSFFSWIWSLFE